MPASHVLYDIELLKCETVPHAIRCVMDKCSCAETLIQFYNPLDRLKAKLPSFRPRVSCWADYIPGLGSIKMQRTYIPDVLLVIWEEGVSLYPVNWNIALNNLQSL